MARLPLAQSAMVSCSRGLFGIALGTGLWVLGAVVFNLITELVGGVRVTVLEEEVVVRPVEPSQGHR